jgi:hypothetical protein
LERDLILQNDSELNVWVLNLRRLGAGSFLQSIGEAAQRADMANYALLRPLLIQLKEKYPKYSGSQSETGRTA